jgi:hypothetical protein
MINAQWAGGSWGGNSPIRVRTLNPCASIEDEDENEDESKGRFMERQGVFDLHSGQ